MKIIRAGVGGFCWKPYKNNKSIPFSFFVFIANTPSLTIVIFALEDKCNVHE